MALASTALEAYFDQRAIVLMEAVPGRRAPLRFSDPGAEHLATRRAAGLFDFSFMSCMQVKGTDSPALLNAVQTREDAKVKKQSGTTPAWPDIPHPSGRRVLQMKQSIYEPSET